MTTLWHYKYKEKISACTRLDKKHYITSTGRRIFPHTEDLYETQEAAQTQKDQDKLDPTWIRRNKFYVRCCKTLIKYLAHKTNINENNITAHKTESGYLHVSWSTPTGLHKHKQQQFGFNLAELIEKMVNSIMLTFNE